MPYLDDWSSQSRTQTSRGPAALVFHVTQLGLTVIFDKSSLVPSQRVEFSDIILNSQEMTAVPSPWRVSTVLILLSQVRKNRVLTYRAFLRLLSMLTAALAVIPLDLLFLPPVQIRLNGLNLDPKQHRNRPVTVTAQCL